MKKDLARGDSPPDETASHQVGAHAATPEIETGALPARLRALIGGESVSSFGRKCGIAESVLRTYLSDGRMPPLDKALAISAAGGVTLDWLATGRGRRMTGQTTAAGTMGSGSTGDAEGSTTPALDPVVLEGILKVVLETHGTRALPEQLAAATIDLYQRTISAGQR